VTELKEELRPRPDESAADYAERTKAVLERPSRQAARPDAAQENKDRTTVTDESMRRFRTKAQEHEVGRTVSEFEAKKKRLYRSDGAKVHGEEEHSERLGKLKEELREKVEAVAAEAREDAEGYEREALALSYTDPSEMVRASERGRLEASRAFVKEDCEDMGVAALAERISAVSAGDDRVAKVLHARYGRRYLEAATAESNRNAAAGRPAGPDAAAELRRLGRAVSDLEAQLEDPAKTEKKKALAEAAAESRSVARGAR
jgi:hypothetical protein